MYNHSHNRTINSGLQPIVVNSSNNYNASCNGMNDNIFTVPAGQSINNSLNLSSNNYNNMDASRNGMSGTFTIPDQSVNNNPLNLSSNSYNNMDAPCNGMRGTFTIPGQQSSTTSNESIAQLSPYVPYIDHVNNHISGQNTQYTSQLESSSSINSLNITINSPQINLSEVFKFGFKVIVLPISPPIINNPNQHICLNSQLRQ